MKSSAPSERHALKRRRSTEVSLGRFQRPRLGARPETAWRSDRGFFRSHGYGTLRSIRRQIARQRAHQRKASAQESASARAKAADACCASEQVKRSSWPRSRRGMTLRARPKSVCAAIEHRRKRPSLQLLPLPSLIVSGCGRCLRPRQSARASRGRAGARWRYPLRRDPPLPLLSRRCWWLACG